MTARADMVRTGVRSPDDAILEAVLRAAPIGVIVLDRDLRIVRMSLTAESDGRAHGRRMSAGGSSTRGRASPTMSSRRLHRVACGRASRVDMRSESPDWRADRIIIAAVTDAGGGVDHVVWMWTEAFGYRRHLNGVVRTSRPGRSP